MAKTMLADRESPVLSAELSDGAGVSDSHSEKVPGIIPGHTPGPWVVGEWDDTLGYDCMTGGVKVGPVYLDGSDYGQKRCQPIQPADKARLLADARLIAAAHYLLAFAVATANTYDDSWREGCQERYIGDAARAALAKALPPSMGTESGGRAS